MGITSTIQRNLLRGIAATLSLGLGFYALQQSLPVRADISQVSPDGLASGESTHSEVRATNTAWTGSDFVSVLLMLAGATVVFIPLPRPTLRGKREESRSASASVPVQVPSRSSLEVAGQAAGPERRGESFGVSPLSLQVCALPPYGSTTPRCTAQSARQLTTI